MNNTVILQGKDGNEIRLLLYPFTWEHTKKKNEEEKKKKWNGKWRQKPTTHVFKNDDAYFETTKTQKKKTKT